MKRFAGTRGASAVTGLFMLALGTEATAQVAAAVPATTAYEAAVAAPAGTALNRKAATATAVETVTGSIVQAKPAQSVKVSLAPDLAKEAAWLRNNGWHLAGLVDRYSSGAPLDEQAQCIAVAVYHEARGETVEGQLAVAKVIMNRAASGKYPSTWCGTVKQPWQFSFVNPRTGVMPGVDQGSAAWRRALGVTRLAVNNAVPSLSNDVLWYHADYVAPSWGRRLSRVSKIGTHIFYRA